MSQAHHRFHYVSNGEGWKLELKQCRPPQRVHHDRDPILLVPGYGMNSFIFGYHPRGPSMEEYFTHHGFEVWSMNLRGQGGSVCEGGSRKYNLRDLGVTDLGAAIDYIREHSGSRTGKVTLIGCSLGGTLSFIYAAFSKRNHAGSLVPIGAPLRWEDVHTLVRYAFYFPWLIGLIPLTNTKQWVRLLFPIFVRTPLMKLYMHPEIVDLRNKEFFLETIENPSRYLNREIAEWVLKKDLMIDGLNLSHEFMKTTNPLLCVIANEDGIVPSLTALSAHEQSGSKIKEALVVGTDEIRFAHADLFVSNESHDRVFKPIADWLVKMAKLKSGAKPVRKASRKIKKRTKS